MKEQYDPSAEAFWTLDQKGFSGTQKEFDALCEGRKSFERPRKIEMKERSVEYIRSLGDGTNLDGENFNLAVHGELTRLHFLLGRDLPEAGDSFSLKLENAVGKITALRAELAAKAIAKPPAIKPPAPEPAKTATAATSIDPAQWARDYLAKNAVKAKATSPARTATVPTTKKEFVGTGLYRAMMAAEKKATERTSNK